MVHVSSESSGCCFPIHARSSVPFYRIDEFDLIHVCYIVLFISNAGISIAMITRGYPNCGCSKFEQIIFPNSRFIHGLSMVYPWFIHGLSMVYHGSQFLIVGAMEPPWFIGWLVYRTEGPAPPRHRWLQLKGLLPNVHRHGAFIARRQ